MAEQPSGSAVATVVETWEASAAVDERDELLERLADEQRQSWERGEPVFAREFLQRYQTLAEQPFAAAELIYHEFLLRQERGAALPFEEYLREYPAFAKELQDFFEVDHGAGSLLRGMPELGRRVGNYVLLEEVGRGGMGVVYKAWQGSLKRTVAVKMILSGQLASEAEVQRFRREAQMAAGLQHPNIVAVHEVGEHDGQHYFSMDYVDGTSLAALGRDTPMPAAVAAKYVQVLADAIHYAHEREVLHRDLKPGNVLLDQAGNLRITDFGLARRITGESRLTISGQIVGTPSYMPPEQASGHPDAVSRASDVYALGAILYDLLTGQPPFRAESPLEILRQVAERDPAPPHVLNANVPRDLETICLKCLEKEPARRYGTAAALAQDLNRFLKGEPIQARPVSQFDWLWKWCRRNRLLAGLIGTVSLLVLATAVGSTLAAWFLNAARKEASASALAEAAAKEEANNHFKQAAEVASEFATLYFQLGRQDSMDEKQYKRAEQPLRRALAIQERLVRDHPLELKYQRDWARSLGTLGRVCISTDRYEEADRLIDQALAILAKLSADHPTNVNFLNDLATSQAFKGDVNYDMGRSDAAKYETAAHWYGQSAVTFRAVLAQSPQNILAGGFLPNVYHKRGLTWTCLRRYEAAVLDFNRALERSRSEDSLVERAWALVCAGEYPRAVADVDLVAARTPRNGKLLYNMALVYSRSSAAARKDVLLSEEKRDLLAEQYAIRAVVSLTKAHSVGVFNDSAVVNHLKQSQDFAAVRNRADFQELFRIATAKSSK